MNQEDEFLKEIQEAFLFEASDMLIKVEDLSLQLEKSGSKTEIFAELARVAHNLKGSGKAVGLDEISSFSHKIEDFILAIKDNKIEGHTKHLDLLFFCLDTLKGDIEKLSQGQKVDYSYEKIFKAIDQILSRDTLQLNESNIHSSKDNPHAENNSQKEKNNKPKKNSESIRISKDKLDALLDSLGEQVLLQSMLDQYKFDIENKKDLIQKTITQLNKQTIELQKQVLSLTTISFGSLFVKLERSIRDAAKICGKKVNVHFSGEDTEADKSLIESLSDPLVHMVRNAVDHGLEDEPDRLIQNKSLEGNIHLDVRRVGGQIWIDIIDDGKGLDPDFILKKAIAKNIISSQEAERLPRDEVFNLIFANGFSTKESTSEISGRGVGMNVVLDTIQSIRGTIQIDSQLGRGTCFRLKLPLSLAIFNGAVVKVNETQFVIPNSDIFEIIHSNEENKVLLSQGRYGLRIRDHIFEIFNLKKIFNSELDNSIGNEIKSTFILTNKGSLKAFQVDEVIGIQKIVLKPIREELKSRKEFAASTILSDGSPSIILSLSEFKQAS
jgi:two-component system chemotaxis sensor kinase CheA